MFKFKLPVFTQTNPIWIWDVSKAKSHRESLGLLPQTFVTPIVWTSQLGEVLEANLISKFQSSDLHCIYYKTHFYRWKTQLKGMLVHGKAEIGCQTLQLQVQPPFHPVTFSWVYSNSVSITFRRGSQSISLSVLTTGKGGNMSIIQVTRIWGLSTQSKTET